MQLIVRNCGNVFFSICNFLPSALFFYSFSNRVSSRLAAMDGISADEVGRSINGTGSRATGATICLKRLGVAVKVAEEQQPKRRRTDQKCSPEKKANNDGKGLSGSQPADTPRAGRRKSKPQATPQKQGRTRGVKASNRAKGKLQAKRKESAPAAAPRRERHVQLGQQAYKEGTDLYVLEQVLQAARAHGRGIRAAADPLERSAAYANFLSALPSSLCLGDYTSKFLIRKHLLQHIAAGGGEPKTGAGGRSPATPFSGPGLGNISMAQLLEIFPDVGKHLSGLHSGLTPNRLAKQIGCPVEYLTMWPCLMHEALQHRPENVELLWSKATGEIQGIINRYRKQWGFAPSPRVLFAELANRPVDDDA